VAHQITEAFPWDTAPTFLIRDNDCAYGEVFTRRVRSMGIRDRPIAPRSPWQNGYVERAIGSIREKLGFTLEATGCWHKVKTAMDGARYNPRDPFSEK